MGEQTDHPTAMDASLADSPALTLAIALAVGMLAQLVARHLRVPGIVLLLAAGVVLGPDGLGVVVPRSLGPALMPLVGFAVAVILFEGGLNLNVRRLLSEALMIRRLVTVGAVITTVGGTLAAYYVMGWGWRTALLFGTLVSVTGPTVITPLLRRIQVNRNLAMILEAEAVFIDAIGAIMAVAALEIALGPAGGSWQEGARVFVVHLGTGTLFGLAGGVGIAMVLSSDRLVPEGMANTLTLSLVLVLYQGCDALFPESGIVAAPVAGVVVGNVSTRQLRDLRDFKEQLTLLMIGLLFVLLAADVRLTSIASLGFAGVGTVLALMLVVRPLNVAINTVGSDLTMKDRAFLAWLAPRGIVAASVASLFAGKLEDADAAGAGELRALVFLVIAITVAVQGLSGGLVATALGVRRPRDNGYVILGANALGRRMARIMGDFGERVVFVDANPRATHAAEEEGFRAFWGNALDERVLMSAELETRAGVIAATGNDELNLLFLRRSRNEFRVPSGFAALSPGAGGAHVELAEEHGGRLLFGAPQDVDMWIMRLETEQVTIAPWRFSPIGADAPDSWPTPDELLQDVLPILLIRDGKPRPIDDRYRPRVGDVVHFAVAGEGRDNVIDWLSGRGWKELDRGAEQEKS